MQYATNLTALGLDGNWIVDVSPLAGLTNLTSLTLGCVALVPNVLPIILVVGSMGWLGLPINIATAMIACRAWLTRPVAECRFLVIAEMHTPALKTNSTVTNRLRVRSWIIWASRCVVAVLSRWISGGLGAESSRRTAEQHRASLDSAP